MGEPTIDPPAAPPQPPRRRRRQRPNGRWTNPASLLQAARFARKLTAKQATAEIRQLCPGHAGKKCKLDQSKMSDYENLRRRPSVDHIETFCRYYQMSPESLGLITWRDEAATEPDPTPSQDDDCPAREQLLMRWLRDSAVSIATAVTQAMVNCLPKLTEEELLRIIGETLTGGAASSEDARRDAARTLAHDVSGPAE